MLRILLVRHGLTHDNVAGITQGHSPGALTPLGRAQAAALGSRLAGTRFSAVYCSDLGRCVETLQIATVATDAASEQPAPQYLPLLRERGAGVFEGTPLGTVDAAAAAAGKSTREFRPDGGESWGDVRTRAAKFLLLLASHIPRACEESECVLAVSHGGFIRAFISAAAERSPPNRPAVANAEQRAGNTAVYTFELQRTPRGSWHCALVSANDCSHLEHLEAAAEHETE